MKRSKFTEEQIIAILREQEAGAKTAEVCRRHGISGATFYAWKAKFGGMEALDAPYLQTGFWPMVRKRAGWLTVLLVGETMHLFHALALLLVLGGIAIAEWGRPQEKKG